MSDKILTRRFENLLKYLGLEEVFAPFQIASAQIQQKKCECGKHNRGKFGEIDEVLSRLAEHEKEGK